LEGHGLNPLVFKERKMSQILQTIEDALSEVLDERVTNLSMATDLQRDLDLDSIRFVQFLLTLEDKVSGLLFNPDTLSQSSFNRVESLIGYIESNRCTG
jgi:acyl carrier protein